MFAPDPKWLEVFKLPLRTTVAVALAIDVLLALVLTHILDLGPLGPFALPVLIILAVVSTAMAVVGVVHALLAPFREKRRHSALLQRRAIRRKEEEERRAQMQETALAQLDYLSKEEIAVVANALAMVHQPSIPTCTAHPLASCRENGWYGRLAAPITRTITHSVFMTLHGGCC